MSTIKLKRGSGTPPNSSLAQYEVAMDVTAKQLYTSTDGTDVVTLSNEYTDVDAVSAIEQANLTLAGNNVAEGGFQVYASSGGGAGEEETLLASRVKSGGLNNRVSDMRTISRIKRDLDTVIIDAGNDTRGPSLDYFLTSDSGAVEQRLGGLAFQSGSDDDSVPNYMVGWGYDNTTGDTLQIYKGNHNEFSIFGKTLAQTSALITNTYVDENDDDQGDVNVVPLTVKSGPNTGGATVSEFWNISDQPNAKVKLRIGLEDSGTGDLTSHGEIRTVYDNDRKNLVLGLLNDNGGGFDYVLSVSKDTVNQNEKKVNMEGQFKVDTNMEDYNAAVFLEMDMENAEDPDGLPQDYIDGINTNSDFKGRAGGIPDGAEIFQRFTFAEGGNDPIPAGFFGCRYDADNNGELSTMKMSATKHDDSDESTLGVNTKNAFTDVPFKYAAYTDTTRNALTVDAGTMIYNSTTGKMNYYNGSAWRAIDDSAV